MLNHVVDFESDVCHSSRQEEISMRKLNKKMQASRSAAASDGVVMASGMQRTRSGSMQVLFADKVSQSTDVTLDTTIAEAKGQSAFPSGFDVAGSTDSPIERQAELQEERVQSEELATAFQQRAALAADDNFQAIREMCALVLLSCFVWNNCVCSAVTAERTEMRIENMLSIQK